MSPFYHNSGILCRHYLNRHFSTCTENLASNHDATDSTSSSTFLIAALRPCFSDVFGPFCTVLTPLAAEPFSPALDSRCASSDHSRAPLCIPDSRANQRSTPFGHDNQDMAHRRSLFGADRFDCKAWFQFCCPHKRSSTGFSALPHRPRACVGKPTNRAAANSPASLAARPEISAPAGRSICKNGIRPPPPHSHLWQYQGDPPESPLYSGRFLYVGSSGFRFF